MRLALRATTVVVVLVVSMMATAQMVGHSKRHFHRMLALDVRPPPTTATSTTSMSTAPTTTTATTVVEVSVVEVSVSLYAEWSKVAVCEEGGWIGSAGGNYPDSLGITRANWYMFGGGADVSPAAQIAVAERFIAHYGIGVPDQHGCQRGGW